MHNHRLAGRLAVGILATLSVTSGWAHPEPEPGPPPESLAKALIAETDGEIDRRKLLVTHASEAAPDHPAVRWHTGFVRAGSKWVAIDEYQESARKRTALTLLRRR